MARDRRRMMVIELLRLLLSDPEAEQADEVEDVGEVLKDLSQVL